SNSQEPLTFIEGVGGNKGIIWKIFGTFMWDPYLLCSFKDGLKTAYTNLAHNGSCNITGLAKAESETRNIKLFPNPTQNQLNILSDFPNQDHSVKILNTLGQTVLVFPDFRNQSLDISTLPPGLYLVQIEINKKIYSKQFVKQ
ncbi:MAG TPA: T9SS type A sorting domain-containing protein, partial [Adhaeribacter sp.]|nr:T9SS type A sorting domain-containing protein [Adhaeribacter sp.]